MKTQLANSILDKQRRLAMPIGVYAGLEMTKATVKDAVTNADAQTEAVLALHKHLNTTFMLTAMDLSAEAEAFGCKIHISEDEIPTVIGRLVTNRQEIENLPIPEVGEKRTQVHLNAARKLIQHSDGTPVLGGCIGPFTLAGRIFGVSEMMELTINDEEAAALLLDKAANFLTQYNLAFREIGVQGIIMAEPAAGLLSPRALAKFSSSYIKQIVETVQNENFTMIYHNCGAKNVHMPKILEIGAEFYHFGAAMNLPAALQEVDSQSILSGNLDPTAVFYNGTVEDVIEQTRLLLQSTKQYANYVLSSGCDIPPGTPLANIEAFYHELANFNQM